MERSRLITLPKILDQRGNLSFFESNNHIPFDIKRMYWIYDVPGGEFRGGHAFKNQKEFIVALSGSLDVVVTEENNVEQRYALNRSYFGLFVDSGVWRRIENFSTNSVALIVCNTDYDEKDYIRDFEHYKNLQING